MGSNPTRGHGCLSVVSVVCCQVEVSATDWSFVQRSPTDCGASLYVIKKPRKRGGYSPLEGCKIQPPMGVVAPGENIVLLYIYIYSTNIPTIMIINRIYETQNLLSL